MYVDIIDFRYLVIQKAAVGMLIGLVPEVIVVKIVATESPVVRAVEVNRNNTQKEMALT